jgi:hypothetical protein
MVPEHLSARILNKSLRIMSQTQEVPGKVIKPNFLLHRLSSLQILLFLIPH